MKGPLLSLGAGHLAVIVDAFGKLHIKTGQENDPPVSKRGARPCSKAKRNGKTQTCISMGFFGYLVRKGRHAQS